MKYTEAVNLLGVTHTATTAEVKQAYRQMAKKYHPDVNKEDDNAEVKFKKIYEAYQVLLNGPKDSYVSDTKTSNYSQSNNYSTANSTHYTPPKQNYIFLYLSIFAIIFTIFILVLLNQIPIHQTYQAIWYVRSINPLNVVIGGFFIYFIYQLGKINLPNLVFFLIICIVLFTVGQAILADLMALINSFDVIFNRVTYI